MDVSDVTKIVDLTGVPDVNAYLDSGWEMLQTYIETHGTPPAIAQTAHYVMAWRGDNPKYPEQPPEPPTFGW